MKNGTKYNSGTEGKDFDKYFEMVNQERGDMRVDVDKAWERLSARLKEDNLVPGSRRRVEWNMVYRVAAVIVIAVATTFSIRFLAGNNDEINILTSSTTAGEKNLIVNLADGSTVTLNRNSTLTYPDRFKRGERRVSLSGEAFFDITPDASKPFVIDAGRGEVKVLGTSFNVITNNDNSEIEVFVATGRVLLTSSDGSREISLDPGYIGRMNGSAPVKEENSNPNYMAWNTEVLEYNGTRLEEVFKDLKRVHDITIEVSSQSIMDELFTTEFRNNSPETIIRSICTSFNLSFENKDGIYYLSR